MRNAIALGTFDGLHEGHRAVLSKTFGFRSVAVTFKIPPKAYFAGKPELLMLPEEKFSAMHLLGIDEIRVLDFNEVRQLCCKDFLDLLCKEYDPARIVCGFNYRFGKDAAGDCEFLKNYCNVHGIEFSCLKQVSDDFGIISSSSLREQIRSGNFSRVNKVMFEPFGFSGEVINGDHRGRTLGFPTINQVYPELLVVPALGVYITDVIVDGKCYSGVTNIGYRPTFPTNNIGCETFLLDFSGDLYGKNVTLKFKRFLRFEQKFNSEADLVFAVNRDIETAKKEKSGC